MRTFFSFLFMISILFVSVPLRAEESTEIQEARRVIERFTGGTLPVKLELSLTKDGKSCDSYAYSVVGGELTVKGSSGVALCHGFYKYIKSINAGINSWTGNRFVKPATLPDLKEVVVTSPYRDHYYFNVVTYGYTMPYWDEARWDKELDWMALHGIDMPLALVAQEAITRKVWLGMGLTNVQIDAYFVGAAHLPWMRMGNISGRSLDGPLTEKWHTKQIALMKHILGRMRALGMRPIVPAFAGFVPKTITEVFPAAKITTTYWGGSFENYRLDPEDVLFKQMGTKFVQEWEKEFGECKYYLADSFNEMAVPSDLSKLTTYGDITYGSIKEANPNAVWVLQGWMLGYQRGNWTEGKLQAMMKNVPNDKMMILDMAADYNNHFWGNGYNWDVYSGFFGKDWVWSVIPNMGGKNCLTGRLDFYANGRLDALTSSNKGNLTGYGFAPEGIENNEVIYELLTDGGWTDQRIDLDSWLAEYASCRYGSNPPEITEYFDNMKRSAYGSFTDHPRYGWLMRPSDGSGQGSANTSAEFYTALEKFSEASPDLSSSALYKCDLIEASAMYAGGRIVKLTQLIKAEISAGNKKEADSLIVVFTDLMLTADRLLTCHPTFQLERWEDMAKKMGTDTFEENRYARNARRIVSTWGYSSNGSVNDYAARMWSGLIRDYYLPRWLTYFNNKLNNKSASITALEDAFVSAAPKLSTIVPVTDTIALCLDLIKKSRDAVDVTYERVTTIQPSTDLENHWYAIRSGYDGTMEAVITEKGNNAVVSAEIYSKAGTQMWRFIKSGTLANRFRIEGRYGYNIASSGGNPTAIKGTSNTTMFMSVQPDGRWGIFPGGQTTNSFHISSAPSDLLVWEFACCEGSKWTLENVDEAIVPETTSDDYTRYKAIVNGLRGSAMNGQVGQVKSVQVLDNAIDTLTKWSNVIDHSSYNSFLAKWDVLYNGLFWPSTELSVENDFLNAEIPIVLNRRVSFSNEMTSFSIADINGKLIPSTKRLEPGIYFIKTELKTYKIVIT